MIEIDNIKEKLDAFITSDWGQDREGEISEFVLNKKDGWYISCTFKNGNQIIALDDWIYGIFGVVAGRELLSLFSVYEPGAERYNPKLDVMVMVGHETVHTIYSDGTFDSFHTR